MILPKFTRAPFILTRRSRDLLLPGSAGDFASTPDAAVLDITGDISFLVYLSMADWTPAAENVIISKFLNTGNQRSYKIGVTAVSGTIGISTTSDGATILGNPSTVAITAVSDGQPIWIMGSLDVSDGSGNRVANYYYSLDGITFTQLGTTVTTVGNTAIHLGTATMQIGAQNAGSTSNFAGNIYSSSVWSGLITVSNGLLVTSGATLVANFDNRRAVRGATSFTDSTGLVWTKQGNAAFT